jgi:hypothetical protein
MWRVALAMPAFLLQVSSVQLLLLLLLRLLIAGV